MKNSIENLYKKGATETSPTALDNLILSQAKQSCEATIKAKPRRWMYSLATAAVFVFGFSMIINLQNVNHDRQLAPQIEQFDDAVEVEFIQEEQVQRLKKDKAPAKIGLSAPEAIDLNELKEKSRMQARQARQELAKTESYSLSTKPVSLESPPIVPVAKPKPTIGGVISDAAITDADLGMAHRGNIGNIAKNEQQVITDNSGVSPALEQSNHLQQDNYNSQDDNVKLDKVVVTGSRISRSDLEEDNIIDEKLARGIKKLKTHIRNKHRARAKRLLKKLKKKYPDYDFSEYSELVSD